MMKKIKRQQIKESITSVSPYELSGSPEDICKKLRTTQDAYLEDRNGIRESCWSWESTPYSDHGAFELVITRLENDKEYDARVKKLMKIGEKTNSDHEKQDDRELKEYHRLKKKFGDNYLHRGFEK
jgi:hypothetical protein